jgi:hypothetical protein
MKAMKAMKAMGNEVAITQKFTASHMNRVETWDVATGPTEQQPR